VSVSCPQPTGYVPVVCPNHTPFHPAANLAHTGVDIWPMVAIAVVVIIVGLLFWSFARLFLTYRRLRRKDRQSTR
jgi:heme/copper-type cytochrome/quinol oxidase subunit 2